ncbi:MAG: MmcQ/YjbR family DNA-binding protein [Proteobacteria bacterium]|nr:MmcQ/YjbR family DNA-binding protein [Pseudomonadota bacterium]
MTSPAQVRALAMALPEAYERPHRRQPTFWVHERIFCIMPSGEDHITVKLDRDDQLNMIEGHPGAVRPARLYSHHGWTYVDPAVCDDDLMALLLRLAWTHVAPKRLSRGSDRPKA